MAEEMVYYPPEDFRKKAFIKSMEEYKRMYEESVKDPEGFWSKMA